MRNKPQELGRRGYFFTFVLLSMAASYWVIRVNGTVVPPTRYEAMLLLQVFLLWPLLFFTLVYPHTRKAKQVLLPLLGGMLFGSLVLPDSAKYAWNYIDMLRWVVIVAFGIGELWALLLLVRALPRLLRTTTPDEDIAELMTRALGDSVPTRFMTAELLMWFYALLSWGTRNFRYRGEQHFHTHSHEGNASTQVGFLVIVGVEMPIAHVFLAMWSEPAAIIAGVISIYGFLWMLGEYRASRLRPVSLDRDHLYIRMGVTGNEQVRIADIAEVASCNERFRGRDGLLRRMPVGTTANIMITLRQPTLIPTTFGTGAYTHIALAVDEPRRLIESLRS